MIFDRPRRLLRRRSVWLTLTAVLVASAWVRLGPVPEALLGDRSTVSTVVVDRHGHTLYEALSADGTRAIRIAPDAIPPTVAAATLAAEDRRFYSHIGVDPIAIARAMKRNVASLRIVEGGSTISQQLAKLLLSRDDPKRRRGWLAKLREATLALRLEHRLSKRELLAMYLTLAAYGNQITGIERASQAYFGTSAANLTPAQAAFLAALPQRPSTFNPRRSTDAAVARQRTVLRRMVEAGSLTEQDAAMARAEQLVFTPAAAPFLAPHFVTMVLSAAGDPKPSRIETTLDAGLQADVAGIIAQHRPVLRRHGANNVAVVVLDNDSGEWLAWEGSGDYADETHGGTINGPTAPRQPGSALKPFTYALAFDRGFSPASVLADVPSSFPTAEPGIVYRPRNYDNQFRGPLLARAALAGSENVPAVALASSIGIPDLLRFLTRAGLTTFDKNPSHYGLGLTLGNAEVRLDELTAAYSALARYGEWAQPTYLRDRPGTRRPLVSARTAFWIADILSDPEAREFIFGRGGALEFPFPVAVKTGTSQAYHDNWTIGFSQHVTVGVWVGNFDRTPLRNSSGVTGAAPIFHSVMLAAHRRAAGTVEFDDDALLAPPPDTTAVHICALSGLRANAWCPVKRREWVAAGTADLPCAWHHRSDEGVVTVLPPEYDAWKPQGTGGRSASVRAEGDVRADVRRADGRNAAAPRFAIVNPADGSTYSIDPTLRREFQTISLRVVADTPSRIEWRVDGRVVGVSASRDGLDWPLVPGQHEITARDEMGRTASATIVVR